MRVLTVYVGQGELVAVRHRGEAVIVDSKWFTQGADDIERQLRMFLKNQSLVGLVLTGFDNDHADPVGVDYILGAYQPAWVMYPRYYKDTDNATEVFNVIRKHERLREGTGDLLRKISIRLDSIESRSLHGLSRCFEYELFSPHIQDMDSSNNCSIVLKLSGIGGDGFSYLITGDTENERWDTITRLFGEALKSDVLSAPHHGSKNATHPKMALLVSPNTVLISAGIDNQYGHPDPQAVKLYNRIVGHVFQTNIENGVSLYTKRQGDDFLTLLAR